MVISAPDGGDIGYRPGGGGDICPPLTEHHFTIHCDSTDIAAVYGGGAASGSAGSKDMVVKGRLVLRECEVDGESIRIRCGGGVIGRGRVSNLISGRGIKENRMNQRRKCIN